MRRKSIAAYGAPRWRHMCSCLLETVHAHAGPAAAMTPPCRGLRGTAGRWAAWKSDSQIGRPSNEDPFPPRIEYRYLYAVKGGMVLSACSESVHTERSLTQHAQTRTRHTQVHSRTHTESAPRPAPAWLAGAPDASYRS